MPRAPRTLVVALALLVHLGCGTSRVAIAPGLLDRAATDQANGAADAKPEESVSLVASPALIAPPVTLAEAPRAIELDGPRSQVLACGLFNPMPGGVAAGYAADTGLDLAGSPRDVYAIASGTLEYAETGHTAWNGRHDSPWALRLRLDEPIARGDRRVTHVWYAHLSEVAREVHEGSAELVHVRAGERLGRSGSANGSPHLHLGMLLDGEVDQSWGSFLLEDEVRAVLCSMQKGKRLPAPPERRS